MAPCLEPPCRRAEPDACHANLHGVLHLLLALALFAGWAAPSRAQPLPEDAGEGVVLTVSGAVAPGAVTLDDVLQGRLELPALDLHRPHRLADGRALWLRLHLRQAGGARGPMVLVFPTPIVDEVVAHQPGRDGRWEARRAGDQVALRDWPVSGRYPAFPLAFAADGQAQVYVKVRHGSALSLPVAVMSQAGYQHRAVLEHLLFGVGLGAAALLVAHCGLRAWRLRDAAYLLLAGYAIVALLAVAGATGVAGHLLWGGSGRWVDVAPGFLTLLAAGVALFITGYLTAAVARMPRLARVLAVLGWAALPLALTYAALDRSAGLAVLGAYVLASALLSIVAASLTWRRGDPVGLWMLMGAVPLTAAVLVTLGRSLGWVEASWLTDYALVAGLLVELPMLLGALNARSRERRSAQLRALASGHRDPLTGLARSKTFYSRVLHALARFAAHREPTAIVLLEIANLPAVQASRGEEAAEECLLRAVIKVRALLRDIDTAARLGDARFGVLLEGVGSRERATEFATRLVAAGLMQGAAEGEGSEVPLRFHVVMTLLPDYAPPAEQLLREMAAMLTAMGPRTRKPVRFLTAADTPVGVRASDGGVDEAAAAEALAD